MPWFHVQWGTYGSWLPGDPRGFRNRDHRIHSSGDYRHPPPKGEHAGLRFYALEQLKKPVVVLPTPLRARVRDAVVSKSIESQVRLAALSVSRVHAHALMKTERHTLGQDIGKLKRSSSHAIRDAIPGVVWAAKYHQDPVTNLNYFWTVFNYILEHESKEGASIWHWDGPCGPDEQSGT